MQSSFCALLMASSNSDKFCRFGKKFLRHCRLLYFIGVKWLNLHNKKKKRKSTKCAEKRQRKSSSWQNTCVTHARRLPHNCCRVKTFCSILFWGCRTIWLCWWLWWGSFPLANDKSFAGNFECQFTLFDSSGDGSGGRGRIPQAVTANCCWAQPEGGVFKLSVDKHAKSRSNRPWGLTMRMAMGNAGLAGTEQASLMSVTFALWPS